MIKNIVILIVLCLLTHSCIDSERVKRLVRKNDGAAMPQYLEDKDAMLDDIKSVLNHEKVITGFESGTRNGTAYNGLRIIVSDAPVSYDNDEVAVKFAQQIDPIIKKHIKNLTDFDLYKIEFTTSSVNENVEKVTSIKITQEQLTPIL